MPRASPWDDNRWLDPPPPVTLPRVAWLDKATNNDEVERREAARKFAEARLIKAGAEAWALAQKGASYENWLAVGRALQIGKAFALTHAKQAWGRAYSKAFSEWTKQHHFDMPASTRSHCVQLAEHETEITKWRDALPERQKRRLIHPLSVIRRWRAATQYGDKPPADLKRDAIAGWRRFVACASALGDEAAPLWAAVFAEAAARQAFAS
jgi:hypothetical protein